MLACLLVHLFGRNKLSKKEKLRNVTQCAAVIAAGLHLQQCYTQHAGAMKYTRDAVAASSPYAVGNVSCAHMSDVLRRLFHILTWPARSAAPRMHYAAPTPRYLKHAFLSLFITTCTCLDYPTLLLLYSISTTHSCQAQPSRTNTMSHTTSVSQSPHDQ